MNRKINKIVIHHSCTDQFKTTVGLIRHIHSQRGLGNNVQYHYMIWGDGKVRQTRSPSKIGHHCFGNNETSLAVTCTGNFEEDEPTNHQLWSLEHLLIKLCRKHSLGTEAIDTHSVLGMQSGRNTVCPGRNLIKHMAALRINIRKELEEKKPLPPEIIVAVEEQSKNWFQEGIEWMIRNIKNFLNLK